MIKISLIILILISILDAIKDTLYNRFSKSIFKNLNPKFWKSLESWKHAKVIPILKYPIDGWHLTKSIMLWLIFIPFSIILNDKLTIVDGFWNYIILWALIGVLYTLVFNLFYNKILFKK